MSCFKTRSLTFRAHADFDGYGIRAGHRGRMVQSHVVIRGNAGRENVIYGQAWHVSRSRTTNVGLAELGRELDEGWLFEFRKKNRPITFS